MPHNFNLFPNIPSSLTIDNNTKMNIYVVDLFLGNIAEINAGCKFLVSTLNDRQISKVSLIRSNNCPNKDDCQCGSITIKNTMTDIVTIRDPQLNGANNITLPVDATISVSNQIVKDNKKNCAPINLVVIDSNTAIGDFLITALGTININGAPFGVNAFISRSIALGDTFTFSVTVDPTGIIKQPLTGTITQIIANIVYYGTISGTISSSKLSETTFGAKSTFTLLFKSEVNLNLTIDANSTATQNGNPVPISGGVSA